MRLPRTWNESTARLVAAEAWCDDSYRVLHARQEFRRARLSGMLRALRSTLSDLLRPERTCVQGPPCLDGPPGCFRQRTVLLRDVAGVIRADGRVRPIRARYGARELWTRLYACEASALPEIRLCEFGSHLYVVDEGASIATMDVIRRRGITRFVARVCDLRPRNPAVVPDTRDVRRTRRCAEARERTSDSADRVEPEVPAACG